MTKERILDKRNSIDGNKTIIVSCFLDNIGDIITELNMLGLKGTGNGCGMLWTHIDSERR